MNDDSEVEKPETRTSVDSSTERPVCAQCGDPIETMDWFPVVTETTDVGSVRLHSFCDEACHDAWKRD
ncbi:DUF7576 family protein [Haladaptatus sp. NG-WS-4]